MILETTDVFRIVIDFPEPAIPTCSKCGRGMNKITIMSECIYTIAKKMTRIEGKSTHVHFIHEHPNSETISIERYCPLAEKRW